MESVQLSAVRWVKASMSANLGACVELAIWGDRIAMRDSKDPSAMLYFSPLEVMAWIDGAKKGEFDHMLTSAGRGAADPA
jgi:hypothetical protein